MVITAGAAQAYLGRLRAARDASEHTCRAYECDLRDYRAFVMSRALCPQEEETILAYADHLTRERSAAPRTVRRRMACLRGFYKDLVRSGAMDRSPFAGLEMQLPRARSLPRALTRGEARLLAQRAQLGLKSASCLAGTAWPAAVLLLLSVGLRVGELVRLRPGDLDADSGGLHVRGKGRRERRVFVVDERLRGAVAALAHRPGASSLFAPDGLDWSTQAVRRALRETASAAGIARRVTPHMLRHTCATLLLEDGVDIRYLQRLLGHENIATTAIYAHVGDVGLRKALAGAGLLAGLSDG
jgi:site-specific recombinase XerD